MHLYPEQICALYSPLYQNYYQLSQQQTNCFLTTQQKHCEKVSSTELSLMRNDCCNIVTLLGFSMKH